MHISRSKEKLRLPGEEGEFLGQRSTSIPWSIYLQDSIAAITIGRSQTLTFSYSRRDGKTSMLEKSSQ